MTVALPADVGMVLRVAGRDMFFFVKPVSETVVLMARIWVALVFACGFLEVSKKRRVVARREE